MTNSNLLNLLADIFQHHMSKSAGYHPNPKVEIYKYQEKVVEDLRHAAKALEKQELNQENVVVEPVVPVVPTVPPVETTPVLEVEHAGAQEESNQG